jgi:parallel beta-helix repeat protein
LEGITAGDNNFISNNTIEHNKGIAIGCSGLGNYISENVITNNGCGTFFPSPSNLLIKNTVSNNHEGIVIWDGNNIIYQNNFINNTSQVAVDVGLTNIWDNGYPSGGNYWSHYNGVDFYSGPYQNETGSDGISDTQYTIDATNKDNFPLMAPISTFDVGVWNGTAYDVDVITNSTLSNFQLDTTQKTMSFNVTGDAGLGFCRVTIPNLIIQNMWQGNYTVRVNGDLWAFRNWTTAENTYIYFTYQHPQNKITITPEFPSAIILPLFMTITMLALIFHTLKAKKKNPF